MLVVNPPGRTSFRAITLLLAAALAIAPVAAQAKTASEQPVRARHAMVVTIHHSATDAGVAILKQGGNAVDAAVAVAFALAVVYPQAGNIGGGGFMLIRTHDGRTHFLDYREEAPAAASTNMYLDAKGNVIPGASTVGYKSSGIPGTVAGLVYAQSHFGKLTLAEDMAPAIALAEEGYVLSKDEAENLHAHNLSEFLISARIFQRDGNFYQEGDTFKQPELAATLKRIAADPNDFYKGAMAQQIAAFEKANGGLITAADLAAYQVKDRAPIVGRYRGYRIITAPPPSSGGLVLVEILNILSGYHLRRYGHDRSAGQVHIITEAFRRAYMDRADYLGDPDFTPQPVAQMTSLRYARAWRRTISRTKATPSADLTRPAGFMPPPPTIGPPVHESMQTTHFSIVDSEGNAVANTFTLNNTFGSGVTVEGLGFLLNDEMDDFASKQGVPNMYGLIQSPANSIAPYKRPLSAMTPTIVTRNGKLRYVLGSPGGATIITTVANDVISVIDNHLNIQQAADAPRFHHQYLPDRLDVEKKFPHGVAAQLEAMGYTVYRHAVADEHNPGVWGDSELIAIDPQTHMLLGGHDNRRDYGKAEGY